MADIYSKTKRSEIMSLVRSKNTRPEKEVFTYLRKRGLRFKKHYELVPGTPDVAVPGKKKAVFVDGDFWHGWQFPRWSDKLPNSFWREKISANIRRDRKNFARLRRHRWKVLRIWSHQLSTIGRRRATLDRVFMFLTD